MQNNTSGSFDMIGGLIILLVFIVGGLLLVNRPWESWELPNPNLEDAQKRKTSKAESHAAELKSLTINSIKQSTKTAVKDFIPVPMGSQNAMGSSQAFSQQLDANKLEQQATNMQTFGTAGSVLQSSLQDEDMLVLSGQGFKATPLSISSPKKIAPAVNDGAKLKKLPLPPGHTATAEAKAAEVKPSTPPPIPTKTKGKENLGITIAVQDSTMLTPTATPMKATVKSAETPHKLSSIDKASVMPIPTPYATSMPAETSETVTTTLPQNASVPAKQNTEATPVPTLSLPVMPTVPTVSTDLPVNLPKKFIFRQANQPVSINGKEITLAENKADIKPEQGPASTETPAQPVAAISSLPALPKASLEPTPIRLPKLFLREHIEFPVAKAVIPASAKPRLLNIAQLLKINPRSFKIVGHTDAVGNPQFNQRLSLQRAQSVKTFLIKAGVKAEYLTVSGLGDKRPIDNNNTEEGRYHNQRIEITE